MKKTILVTGSTDGIGLVTAKALAASGHRVIVHGRNAAKLANVSLQLESVSGEGAVKALLADFSSVKQVRNMVAELSTEFSGLDVLINNAGVFKAHQTITPDGLDVRFVVNTISPYLLTRRLRPLISREGRVINLSSAAQSPVELDALEGKVKLDDMSAYAQSKLAITGWTRSMALEHDNGPVFVSVNPGSLLGTKMVKEAFDEDGRDVAIGADILMRAALSDEFSDANGCYFDNDSGKFTSPHPDALDAEKNTLLCERIESILTSLD